MAEPGTFRADTFKTDTFKTWFHRWGSPRWFYERSLRWSFWFGFSAFLILGVAWIWGLGFAPVDHRQGNSYRIMFLHVPNVFMAMSNYLLMATSGAIAMIWKIKLADWVMKRAATIGACFTLIALFTGVVWGKATWGGFLWSDSKILFTVLLLFLYLGVLALKASYQSEEMANKAATILALVGVVNIPIIYFAADWFFSLHQRSGSSMPPSMAWPFWLSVLGGYCFYAWVLLRSVRAEIVQREYKTQWVKELIQEVKA